MIKVHFHSLLSHFWKQKPCGGSPITLSKSTTRLSNVDYHAFSLVEVVLAMGVTSFALLSMVALIPVGLSSARQATDATTESQIIQFSRNELELTSFTNLATAWMGVTNYFDNQGLPTTNGDPSQIYSVSYAVSSVAWSTNGAAASPILINTGPNGTSTNAMTVQVTIVNRTEAGPIATNVFPIVVPNAGF
jgi:uncharacterized protein (TIGR02598 family)